MSVIPALVQHHHCECKNPKTEESNLEEVNCNETNPNRTEMI